METAATVRPVTDLVVVADQAALALKAAELFAETADRAMARAGRFTAALSGGSTPKLLYSLLAAEPYRSRVPWRQTHVFWGDERCVPPDYPDSNFGMAKATFLDRVTVPPEQVHRMQAEREDLDVAAREYEADIARTFGVPPTGEPPTLDLILLGMGADGHTASLFPHTEALHETRRWVVRNYVPKVAANRLTMTAPIINRGAMILFLVAGTDKAHVFREVLEGPADPERLPSQLIRPVAGHLTWLADQAAAGQLGGKGP
jgi:6-phosphogluconolactonase